MKQLKVLFYKWGGLIATLAIMIATSTSDSACWLYYHQPKEPAGLAKFKK